MVETKNEVDALIFSTEKSLAEHGEKLTDELKEEIQSAIDNAKKARDSESLEDVNEKKETLSTASMKIGQHIYGSGGSAGGEGGEGNGDEEKEEAAQEAEFEEKDKK